MTAANDLSVQMASTSTLILIPARMASSRLPGKPLADVAGLPMIVQVLRRAEEAKIGRAVVATDTAEIASAVTAHGGEAVMTRADHPSGSDRIFEALERLDPDGKVETIVNLQGDLPTILPQDIRAVQRRSPTQRSTSRRLPRKSTPRKRTRNPNVVKAIGSPIAKRPVCARSISRARPRRPATGLATITSASMRIAARRSRSSSPAAVAAGTSRKARATARDRSRHADRRDDRRPGAARGRYSSPISTRRGAC